VTGDSRPQDTKASPLGRSATISLAERLAPVQDALADLTREYIKLANADHDPAMWSTWSDLNCALMSVRSAQGRDARDAGYWPPSVRKPGTP
jgi:hypothetical protein